MKIKVNAYLLIKCDLKINLTAMGSSHTVLKAGLRFANYKTTTF
jgi:hypothetical protein